MYNKIYAREHLSHITFRAFYSYICPDIPVLVVFVFFFLSFRRNESYLRNFISSNSNIIEKSDIRDNLTSENERYAEK